MFVKYFKLILLAFFTALLFAACSSSTYTERYSKKETPDKKKEIGSARFTSEKDIKEFDTPPVENHPVSKDEVIKRYGGVLNKKTKLNAREKLLFQIINFLDSPYLYGGESKNGIDCSAFTQTVFKNSLNIDLPRTASEQFLVGKKVSGVKSLKFGDLIFFNTTRTRFPGHVGIYLGGSLFAHSSVHQGVTVSSLKSSYYKDRFVGARRVFEFDSLK